MEKNFRNNLTTNLTWPINQENMANSNKLVEQLNSQLETINVINMYSSLFLIIVGLIGNMYALVVLVYARNKHPHIVGSTYLIILTLTNTAFLLIHFYMTTYVRIIYHFGLDYKTYLQVTTTSQLACKLLNYLRYSFRILNTMMTLSFSIERLLAVYCPLKMRSLDFNCSLNFVVSLLVSFVVPIYALFVYSLVPNDPRYHDNLKITKVISYFSMI